MPQWTFLTDHGRALLLVANDPDAALVRSISTELGVTERVAYEIVEDLTRDGYLVKHLDGRHHRYSIQGDLPLPDRQSKHRTVHELIELLKDRRSL